MEKKSGLSIRRIHIDNKGSTLIRHSNTFVVRMTFNTNLQFLILPIRVVFLRGGTKYYVSNG